MTLSVNIIEGNRGSVCVNDAFSVVRNQTDLIAIIPASDVPGKTADDILTAFKNAAARFTGKSDITRAAKRELGCAPAPKAA